MSRLKRLKLTAYKNTRRDTSQPSSPFFSRLSPFSVSASANPFSLPSHHPAGTGPSYFPPPKRYLSKRIMPTLIETSKAVSRTTTRICFPSISGIPRTPSNGDRNKCGNDRFRPARNVFPHISVQDYADLNQTGMSNQVFHLC